MRNFNFLSKSSSQSCGHSSVTLAMTVGSPSVHRRGAMLKLISVLVLIFTFGIGQMWGADPVASQAPADGSTFVVVVHNGTKYYALPNTITTSSTLAGVEVTVNGSGEVTTENAPTWTLTKGTGTNANNYWLSYKSGDNTYYLYKNGTGKSNYKFAVGTTNKTYWSFTANGTGYTVAAEDRGTTNHVNIQLNGTTFQCYNDASAVRLLPVAASGPTITKSSSMTTFGCNMETGVPNKQSFTIGGTNLKAAISVTPPTGYEICTTENGTYQSTAISLPKNGSNAVATTTIWVRLKASNAAGSYSGNISCTSTDATTQTIAVSGSTPFKVTWIANGQTHATTYVTYAENPGTAIGTFPDDPDPDDYTCSGTNRTFYGWYNGASYKNANTAPDIITTSTKITSDKTFNAVFADASGGGSTTKWVLTSLNAVTEGTYALVNQSNYAFNGNFSSGHGCCTSSTFSFTNGEATSAPTGTCEVVFEAVTGGFKMKVGNNYLYATKAGSGGFSSHSTENSYWEYSSSNWTYNSNTAYLRSADNTSTGFRTYSNNSGDGILKLAKKTTVSTKTYSNFVTTCCTELGQINGSVTPSQTSAVVKLASAYSDAANADGYQLKVEGSSNYNTWTDVAKNALTTSTGVTVNGLACGTEYTAYLRAKGSGNYCEFGTESSVNFTTSKYTVSVGSLTNGTITVSPTTACAGDKVTLTVNPSTAGAGYHLASWSVNGTAQDVASTTFTMPEADVTIAATFEENSVPMAINITSTDKATVTSSVTSALANTNITLSCTDIDEGYQFFGWTVTAGGNPVEVTNPTSATGASFTMPAAVVTVTADIRQMVTVTFKRNNVTYDTQSTYVGGTVTFPSNPTKFDDNYPNFVGWSEAIDGIATSVPTLKSASEVINADVTYHAVFANEPEVTGDYIKITDLAQLIDGKYVIVGEDNSSKKLAILNSEVYGSFYVKATSLTLVNGKVHNPAANSILDFAYNNTQAAWSINYDDEEGGYLALVVSGTHTNLKPNQSTVHYFTAAVSNEAWTLTSKTTSSPILYALYNSSTPEFLGEGNYSSNKIYLFKQELASSEWITKQIVKHTISYNKNTEDEVTGSLPANATIVDGEDYTVSDATLSRAGYNFIGWNTSNTATTAQTTIVNVTADATLYAVWEAIPTYNIEFSVNGAKVEALKLAEQLEGTAIVFPDAAAITAASAFPTTDKKFVGWIEASSYASDEVPTFVTSATATADKVYYAVFADLVSEGGYNKLTSAEGLAAGDKIVVTNGSSVGMKAWNSSDSNCKGTTIEIDGNQITNLGEACELTLGGTEGHWTLFDGTYYIYDAGTSSNNYMKGKTTKDEACEWTITIANATTTVQSVTNTTKPYMRYNGNNSSVFSCYNSGQDAVVLFKKAANVYEDYVTNIATLSGIEITTAPTKTVYKKGEALDLTGMVVKATYSDSRVRTLSSDKYTVDLADEALAASNNKFTVSYTEGETTKTAEQTIAVYELTLIAVTNAPATTTYLEGATFDKTGMVVKATWGTGEDKIVETLDAEDYMVSPSVLDATSITSVTISYTHEDVTKTTTQAVTVNERPSLTMSWKVGNADPTETKIYEEGGKYLLALPAEDPDPVDAGFTSDFEFKGWTADATIAKSGTGITYATADAEMSSAATFRAVFALKSGEDTPAGYKLVDAAPADGETVIIAHKVEDTYYAMSNSTPTSGNALTVTNGIITSSTSGLLWDAVEASSGVYLYPTGQTNQALHLNNSELKVANGTTNGDFVFTTNGAGAYTVARSAGDRWIAGSGNGFTYTSSSNSAAALYIFKYAAATTATYSNYRFAPSNVTAPVIGLTEGTYYGAQNVEITADKAIYYTLDGTNPTNASTSYSSAISLNEAGTKTVKAVAYDSENDDYSAIVSVEYTIVTEIAAPTMPATGKFYEDSKEVTIEHALTAEGAKIYYSYDNAAYSEYSEALEITETKTVWAYATIGSLTSEKVSATYTKGETVTYTKLTSADQLAAGMEFVLVAEYQSGFYGAGALNSTYLEKVNLSAPVANVLSVNDEAVAVFTLDGEPAVWTMSSDAGTLYSNGDKNVNYSNTGNGTWNLTFSENVLTIANNGIGNGNLRYNGSSPRFTTYSGLATVDIYYKEYGETYTLTYKDANGDDIKSVKVVAGYEYTIVNSNYGNKPANYEFLNKWTDGTNTYDINDKIVLTANTTLQPCFKISLDGDVNVSDIPAVSDVVVGEDVTLTVDDDKTLDNLTVENGGKVTLSSNKLTVVGTFTIETTMASGNSGQLSGASTSNFEAGEAYIDITLGANGTNQQWHAFTVPFPVDAMNGIYDLDGNKLTNEVNYAIMDYHGDIRAQGQYGWKKYRGVLVPGTFYIMATDGYRTTYRFKKKAGEALVADNSKDIFEYAASGDGQTTDAGWNGIGNPNLFYGKVNLAVQVLDPMSYTFVTKTAQSTNFVVGTPFFYQATANGSMVMETANASGNYAPARERAIEIKDVPVSFGNEDFNDYLYVTANEDALNTYETGKDLAKMTMTNTPKVAQIFGKAYNTKLCMVHAPMVNNQAEVALELYAPQAGIYTISVPTEREDASLYLTKDGNIIWDLTMSPYEAEFDKGQNNGYGLMLVRKAPQVTTGVETIDNSQSTIHNCQKVILNDHVYILRDAQLYDVTGKAVK